MTKNKSSQYRAAGFRLQSLNALVKIDEDMVGPTLYKAGSYLFNGRRHPPYSSPKSYRKLVSHRNRASSPKRGNFLPDD
jgi:hypothetical protein